MTENNLESFNDTTSNLSDALNNMGISLDNNDVNDIQSELMDGLGLSAELSADWTARFLDGNDNPSSGWVQDLRDDIENISNDYIQSFFNEDVVSFDRIYDWEQDQPGTNRDDFSIYISDYISDGSNAGNYLYEDEDNQDLYDEYGHLNKDEGIIPGDAYDFGGTLLYTTRDIFEQKAFGGNMEDFKSFCGSADDNNIMNAAVSLGCLENMINFIGENGTVDDMRDVMGRFFDDHDSTLLYDSVNDGKFSEHIDVDFLRDALQEIDQNEHLSDDEKEVLSSLIVDNEILNLDFESELDNIRYALINDTYGEYNEHDIIENYESVMFAEGLPEDISDKAFNMFEGWLAECNVDDDDDKVEYDYGDEDEKSEVSMADSIGFDQDVLDDVSSAVGESIDGLKENAKEDDADKEQDVESEKNPDSESVDDEADEADIDDQDDIEDDDDYWDSGDSVD